MKHTSRLFGEFTYKEDQVIQFAEGLPGFPDFHRFALKGNPKTAPICWLLSVEDGGPELALIDPEAVNEKHSLADVQLSLAMLSELGCDDPDALLRFAIVTLPENIKQMSMNLRTPVFIDAATKRGLVYPKPGLPKKAVRCLIYRDLIASRPEDKPGVLMMLRKENEVLEIGDEITVQIMEFANGGVRLGVTAPRHMKVGRGEYKVTPTCETQRADETMNVKRLEGIMHMHRIMEGGEDQLTAANIAAEERAIG